MYNFGLLILESVIGVALISVLIPSVGLAVLAIFRVTTTNIHKFLLSWTLGIATLGITTYAAGLLVGPVALVGAGWVTVVCAVIMRQQWWELFKNTIKHVQKNKVYVAFLFISSVILAGTLMGSWLPFSDGIHIQDGQQQDSLWHIALTRQLLISIPPVHPSSFELIVSNYHYFYNILIAVFAQAFGLKISTLYYQVFPLIVCLLLGSTVGVAAGYPKDKTAGFWAVFLTFFGGSFAYLIPFFLPGQSWHDSSFWVSQTFSMMVNPQLLLSYSLLLTLFAYYRTHKKLSLSLIMLTAVLTASLLGIKAYGWILALVLNASYLSLFLLSSEKKVKTFLLIGLWIALQILAYLCILGIPKTSAFTFLPLWYLTSMVESPDRLNLPYWKILEDHYRAHHNWLRVAQIQLKELFYFVFGNLGSRSIVVFAFIPWIVSLIRKKRDADTTGQIALAATFGVALTLPLLFIQSSGPVWNSIQFWYYGLILGNVLGAQLLAHLSHAIHNRPVRIVLAVLFCVASVPTFFTTVPYKYQKRYVIPQDFITALTSQVQATDRVIVCAQSEKMYNTSLVSALTGARPLLAHPVQIELMYGKKVLEMESDLRRVFPGIDALTSSQLHQTMKDKSIKYALCLKDAGLLEARSLQLVSPQTP